MIIIVSKLTYSAIVDCVDSGVCVCGGGDALSPFFCLNGVVVCAAGGWRRVQSFLHRRLGAAPRKKVAGASPNN